MVSDKERERRRKEREKDYEEGGQLFNDNSIIFLRMLLKDIRAICRELDIPSEYLEPQRARNYLEMNDAEAAIVDSIIGESNTEKTFENKNDFASLLVRVGALGTFRFLRPGFRRNILITREKQRASLSGLSNYALRERKGSRPIDAYRNALEDYLLLNPQEVWDTDNDGADYYGFTRRLAKDYRIRVRWNWKVPGGFEVSKRLLKGCGGPSRIVSAKRRAFLEDRVAVLAAFERQDGVPYQSRWNGERWCAWGDWGDPSWVNQRLLKNPSAWDIDPIRQAEDPDAAYRKVAGGTPEDNDPGRPRRPSETLGGLMWLTPKAMGEADLETPPDVSSED